MSRRPGAPALQGWKGSGHGALGKTYFDQFMFWRLEGRLMKGLDEMEERLAHGDGMGACAGEGGFGAAPEDDAPC